MQKSLCFIWEKINIKEQLLSSVSNASPFKQTQSCLSPCKALWESNSVQVSLDNLSFHLQWPLEFTAVPLWSSLNFSIKKHLFTLN